MALVCTQITEWIEEEVSRPIEEWEERQEQRCKDDPWYDPRGWVCWFVTVLVKVVRWVVVKVGKWVARTVCKIVDVIVNVVHDVMTGVWDVIAGIFTLDWRRILDGLIRIGVGIAAGIVRFLRVALLGDTIDYIIEEINRSRLRSYVRGLLNAKYSGATLSQMKDSIRLDHGAFGLRIQPRAYRTYLDSESESPAEPNVPNLVVLHETGVINLRALCGFDFDEGFWNRKRYKTLKKGNVIGGGGGGKFDNPISKEELDDYLSSRGRRGPKFIVLPLRDGAYHTKIRTAEEKSRELGLMMSFDGDIEAVEVTLGQHIIHDGFDKGSVVADASLDVFLRDVMHRTDKDANQAAASAELCEPITVGIFRYTDGLRGLASTLEPSTCGLSGSHASGVTFIDNQPDEIWKYVPIHELGHYFGLCHVDGLDRIMFSNRENSWWSWWLFPNLLYLQGEPSFVFDEAKAAWDYIVDNVPPGCLGAEDSGPPVE